MSTNETENVEQLELTATFLRPSHDFNFGHRTFCYTEKKTCKIPNKNKLERMTSYWFFH